MIRTFNGKWNLIQIQINKLKKFTSQIDLIKIVTFFIAFNNSQAETISSQKHVGLTLDELLNFNEHLESKINKCFTVIGFLKRLSSKLTRNALLRICKSFVSSHLDYGDIVYDKPNNQSFTSKLERVQYKVCLAITGAI